MQSKLEQRAAMGSLRSLKSESSLIDFCSNDYLGFARSIELKELIRKETDGNHALNGSTGSRLISGNLKYTKELEKQIAEFHNAEAGLLFNSGYDANIGLFSSLPQKGDTILHDELIHASIIDGARLSLANRYSFKHNDVGSLEAKLKVAKGNCYVVVESVYSMDGNEPPLQEIVELTAKYQANLIIDEAHAVGLYPAGLISHLGLEDKVFARVVTFGKAMGVHGAVVLGTDLMRNYLINFARSFIYTTAASFNQVASIKMAYELLNQSEETVQRLKANIALFKQHVFSSALIESNSAIQCIVLYSNDKAKAAAMSLQHEGFDVRAIMSPTVPLGAERIRICLHAFNTAEEIIKVASAINIIINEQ
ncbi:8-amino-7-oxononanoate synthase [Mucilaginibacter sp. 21P]|uniref:aminotransferase class I/II-fold pyridoxal phosphate-dependent enzyme n=1 Tax=Mucilaginibacter sp. 21P TaxID=2778902 RepID=UPI001C56D928|nr:8-amino-7-oxononanoate synthase [Mucilaginibacter sp. 21P]QXV64550.1 8-amino-7-oxononanoate synthase [Mucilaginibacter sp. 21P]